MPIKESELILNPDGSLYHLNLKPENIADTLIFVGDQDRVELVTQYFDSVEFTTQKREFKTQTGYYQGKKLSVISTGIGPDNIDIVMNELDALANIDLDERKPRHDLKSLNIVRIGTSGSIQKEVAVDSYLVSSIAIDTNGMLHFYKNAEFGNSEIEEEFINHTQWDKNKARPLFINGSSKLMERFLSKEFHSGITATAGGFYGPQGRRLRLDLFDEDLNDKYESFRFGNQKITNFEMETAAIYGMSKFLGHNALSLSAIIANRANGTFSDNPAATIDKLIRRTLNNLCN